MLNPTILYLWHMLTRTIRSACPQLPLSNVSLFLAWSSDRGAGASPHGLPVVIDGPLMRRPIDMGS
jgi:hypothetical protein